MTRARGARRLVAVLVAIMVMMLSCLSCSSEEGGLERLDVPFRFGAYVDPPSYTEDNRIESFEAFEKKLGRKLDLYHSYHPWLQEFPSTADRHFAYRGTTLLLSWAGTDTLDIVSGRYDEMIRSRARGLRALGTPVILQWRWEMNRPNLAPEIHSPQDYVAAWRHLHEVFDQVGVDNVEWAWCPLSDALADLDYSAYYPGDDWVDWIGANGYARSPTQTFAQVFDSFFTWAEAVDKPILIGEFARPTDMGSADSLRRWLEGASRTIAQHPSIKAVAYFESARGSSGKYDLIDVPGALEALRDWESAS